MEKGLEGGDFEMASQSGKGAGSFKLGEKKKRPAANNFDQSCSSKHSFFV